MIILHDSKGGTRLDHRKDMSVHISTYTSYDLHVLSVVWKLWCWYNVSTSHSKNE